MSYISFRPQFRQGNSLTSNSYLIAKGTHIQIHAFSTYIGKLHYNYKITSRVLQKQLKIIMALLLVKLFDSCVILSRNSEFYCRKLKHTLIAKRRVVEAH